MRARLVEIAGYTPGREVPLGEALLLGREPGQGGLVISNREASRRHARIFRQGSTWHVEDLNSANGTFVDGVRRQEAPLVDGTLLTIGRTTFRFNIITGTAADELEAPTTPGTPLDPPTPAPPVPPFLPEASTPRMDAAARAPARESAAAAVQAAVAGAQSGATAPRRGPVWNLTMDARSSLVRLEDGREVDNLRREREILNHLYEISRSLGSILHLPQLGQEILSKLFELFPVAENTSIHLCEGSTLAPLAARSRHGGPIAAPQISQTISSLALTDRQAILSTDAAEDARFLNKESIILQRVRSFMCCPLLFRDEVLGILYVDTTDARPRFSVDDLHLLTAVSSQMAVAVKNTRLLEENLREAEVRLHLSRYLPPDLVEQVMHKQIDLNPGGSLCEGTVLFSDVIGFTPMAERLPPELLVQTLNRYFKHMVDSIFRHGGSVNGFGGDSIMALWGVPVQHKDDALRAVRAAIEMQAAIFAFNLTVPEGRTWPLRVGIGLNTGSFVVGNIGSDRHMEYTALGNHVNLAQRAESRASQWQVFLTANSYEHVADQVSVFALPPALLKGVRTPMPIYSVRAVLDQDALLCAIPAAIVLPDRSQAPAMVVRLFPDGLLEVWFQQALDPDTGIDLILDPPEHPEMSRLRARVVRSSRLEEFEPYDGQGCRLYLALEGSRPPLLEVPVRLEPEQDRGYLPRQ